jgi:DNA-directed RNA polymerase specialized sigma24 family protein
LPEVYQSAVRLHYWLGHTTAEIATLLGAPENSVKSYLRRARIALRAKLEESGFSDE